MDSRPSAAELVRQARKKTQMTQQELADKAGVAQSVISSYESGRRQPSLRTLDSLIRATGLFLSISLEDSHTDPQDELTGPVGTAMRYERNKRGSLRSLTTDES